MLAHLIDEVRNKDAPVVLEDFHNLQQYGTVSEEVPITFCTLTPPVF